MRPLLRLAFLMMAVLVVGCATNPFAQFYVSSLQGQPVSATTYLIPNAGDPEVYAGGKPEEDEVRMFENGLVHIGYASFVGPPQDFGLAKARGRELQAAVVLVYSSNPQTVTQTAPVLDLSGIADVLNPKTETTRTTGTVYGGGGSVGYSETSTKTVPRERAGPQTMTYTTTRCDQMATFWVRTKPPRLGITPRDLTSDERIARGSNAGIAVAAVAKGSPAYEADLFRGDIILRIGDVRLMQTADLTPALDRYAGTAVDLVVLRGTTEKTVRIMLNPNQ